MSHPCSDLRLTALASALLMGAVPTVALPGIRLGDNERVNTFTAGYQFASDVARDALGNFVVVWQSEAQDGSGYGIFGQRYTADGRQLGDEFAINTRTTGDQQYPSVAMNASGRFVVAWMGPDADGDGIHVRAYDAQGVALGEQVRANADTTGYQTRPDVAIDGDGNFTVIWTDPGVAGDSEVFQRRFASDGTPSGDGRRVNTTVTGYQDYASIAMDAAGDYVVTWENYTESDGSYHVFYRRFDGTGTAKDALEVPVAVTSGGQEYPAAAMDASGAFVIAWADANYDQPAPQDHAIYARRFRAGGAPRDAEPLTVTSTTASVFPWGLAMDATGKAVITWRVLTTPTSSDVPFRLIGVDGFDSEILRVNTNTTKYHEQPAVAMDADGDFVISWNARASDSDDSNILLQRFRYSDAVNLAIRQNDTPDPAGVGEPIRYTLRVSNLTPPADLGLADAVQTAIGSATGVTLVDTLPPGTTFVSAKGTGWTCTFQEPQVTCDSRRPVRAGDQLEPVLVRVTAPGAAGPLVNRAAVSADQRDPRPGNNDSEETTTIQ